MPRTLSLKSEARISTKDPATMTPAQINAERDRLEKVSSALTRKLIDAGRGREKISDIVRQSDPLSQEYKAVLDRDLLQDGARVQEAKVGV